MITGVSHLLLRARNFAECRETYVGRLGLREVGYGIGPDGNQVCLAALGASTLDLREDGTARPELNRTGTTWISHIAFHVRDAHAAYRVLGERGIRWRHAPSDQPIGHQLIRRRLLGFDDPEHLMVQLAEVIDDEGRSLEAAVPVAGAGMAEPPLCDKIDHIATMVGDMPAKRSFYLEKLGLAETAYHVRDWGEESSFLVGETILELNWNPEHTHPPLHGGTVSGIGFWTADLERAYHELRARGVEVSPPEEEALLPGIKRRLIRLQDPDAMPLQLVQANTN